MNHLTPNARATQPSTPATTQALVLMDTRMTPNLYVIGKISLILDDRRVTRKSVSQDVFQSLGDVRTQLPVSQSPMPAEVQPVVAATFDSVEPATLGIGRIVASGILPDVEGGFQPPGISVRNIRLAKPRPSRWWARSSSAGLEARLHGRPGGPPLRGNTSALRSENYTCDCREGISLQCRAASWSSSGHA